MGISLGFWILDLGFRAVAALHGAEPMAPSYSFSKLGNTWKHYEKVGQGLVGTSLGFWIMDLGFRR